MTYELTTDAYTLRIKTTGETANFEVKGTCQTDDLLQVLESLQESITDASFELEEKSLYGS